MSFKNQNYTFNEKTISNYNIDRYRIHDGNSISATNSGATLKNLNNSNKSFNFYGDGRLDVTEIRTSVEFSPRTSYFLDIREHDIYGWCIYKTWGSDSNKNSFEPNDEVVIYKKHIQSDAFIDELGKWEILTIKEKIIDEDGIHYSIKNPPDLDYSEHNVISSMSLVYQFEFLEIFNNKYYRMNENSNRTTWVPNYEEYSDWNEMLISYPTSIFFIKSKKGIKINSNAYIGSFYGYNGAYGYYKRYRGDAMHYYFASCGPNGSGRIKSESYENKDLMDRRAVPCNLINKGDPRNNLQETYEMAHRPGGFGNNGLKHTDNTSYSTKMPKSDDLSEQIYNGVGAGCLVFGTHTTSSGFGGDTYQANNIIGSCGGGILIIQTPKIEFVDETSRLLAYPGTRTTRRRSGRGAGGSLLLKTEEVLVHSIRNCNTGNLSEENTYITNFWLGHYETAHIDYFNAQGQVQFEIDRFVVEVDDNKTIYQWSDDTLTLDVLSEYIRTSAINRKFKELNHTDDTDDYFKTDGDWNSYDLGYDHGHLSPIYEDGYYYKLYTKGYANIDISIWGKILGYLSSYSIPLGTEIKVAFSIDNGDKWFTLESDGVNISLLNIDETSQEDLGKCINLENLLNVEDWFGFTNIFIKNQSSDESKTIDIAIILKTSKYWVSPEIKNIEVEYENLGSIVNPPIQINPYNGEEFNNEYVNFVWLQPLQESGSLQNRIEISTIPNFSYTKKQIIKNFENGYIDDSFILPYSAVDYDGYNDITDFLKTPYLIERGTNTDIQEEIDTLSFSVDYDNNKINYDGSDKIFYKGQTIITGSSNIDLPIENFKIDYSNVPKSSDVTNYIDFCVDDVSNISDSVASNVSLKDYDLIDYRPHFLYGNTIVCDAGEDGYVDLAIDGTNEEDIPNIFFYDKDATLTVKFYIDDLQINGNATYPTYFSISVGETNVFKIGLDYRLINGVYKSGLRLTFQSAGAYVMYGDILTIGGENILSIVRNDGNISLYLNGVLIKKTLPSTTDDFIDPIGSECHFRLFKSFDSDTYDVYASVIELIHHNDLLIYDEIKELHKVPNYKLFYDFESGIIEAKRVPYNGLWEGNDILEKLDYVSNNSYSRITDNSVVDRSNIKSTYYTTNNRKMCIGNITMKPIKEEMVIRDLVNFKPNGANDFMIYDESDLANSDDIIHNMIFSDIGTIEKKDDFGDIALRSPNRINFDEDFPEVTFIYKDLEVDEDSHISLTVGINSSATEPVYNYVNYYNHFFGLKKKTDGTMIIGVTVYSGKKVIDWNVTTDVNSSLPYPLIDGYIYTLSFRTTNSDYQTISAWVHSPNDDNYKSGVKVWDRELTNTDELLRRGYITKEPHHLETYSTGDDAKWCYYGCRLRHRNAKNPFKLLGLSTRKEDTIINKEPSYSEEKEYTLEMRKETITKLNTLVLDIDAINSTLLVGVSFDGGENFKVFDFDNNEWVIVTNTNDFMNYEDAINLTFPIYNKSGGFDKDNSDVVFKFILRTEDGIHTPHLKNALIKYNGPITIDSWKEQGSYYDDTVKFYFLEDDSWNPYIEPDFSSDSQNWQEMGIGVPEIDSYDISRGSKPSTGSKKIFTGARILLDHKGKWYWRVAAYNGLKK